MVVPAKYSTSERSDYSKTGKRYVQHSNTCIKTITTQRKFIQSLRKDKTEVNEAFHIFSICYIKI